MVPDETTPAPESKKKRAVTRRCPICGHEAWPIAYGMMVPSAWETMPKTEFAGCVVTQAKNVYPATGAVEFGVPKWACQNPECRHRLW